MIRVVRAHSLRMPDLGALAVTRRRMARLVATPSSSEDLLAGLQLVFVAVTEDLADAWTDLVSDIPNAEVHRGSIGDVQADAVVSPANSYGFMDGGIDAHYMELYGEQIQFEARKTILTRHSGELLVGHADIVPTGHHAHPWLIIAPTMRVPMALPVDTVNPFLAMRAVLLLWRDGVIADGHQAGRPSVKR